MGSWQHRALLGLKRMDKSRLAATAASGIGGGQAHPDEAPAAVKGWR